MDWLRSADLKEENRVATSTPIIPSNMLSKSAFLLFFRNVVLRRLTGRLWDIRIFGALDTVSAALGTMPPQAPRCAVCSLQDLCSR